MAVFTGTLCLCGFCCKHPVYPVWHLQSYLLCWSTSYQSTCCQDHPGYSCGIHAKLFQ